MVYLFTIHEEYDKIIFKNLLQYILIYSGGNKRFISRKYYAESEAVITKNVRIEGVRFSFKRNYTFLNLSYFSMSMSIESIILC